MNNVQIIKQLGEFLTTRFIISFSRSDDGN